MDNAKAVALLDRAFESDPMLHYLLPDPVKCAKATSRFHGACLRYAQRYGQPAYAPGEAGLALWLPPGQEHLTYPRMIQTGVAQFGLRLGLALPRLLKADGILTAMHKKYAPGKHWYLFFLAVDPVHHGKGVGSALLEQGQIRAAEQGVPVYLETMTQSNVRFYTKRGFVVQEQRTVAPELTIWGLRWEKT